MPQNTTVTLELFLRTVSAMPSFKTSCAYLIMVALSPFWRMYTKPMNIRPLMVAYNLLCTILSVVSCLGFIYILITSPSMYSKQNAKYLPEIFKLYYWTKIIELMDTVIMILRHKTRQISFLHVFHHSTMVVLSNLACIYTPWSDIAFYFAMNSFVHICLYLYYALCALNPGKPPQWKKQLTQLQLIQFVIGITFSTNGYLYHGFCIYSIVYGLLMMYFFSNFYYHAYINRKSIKMNGMNGMNGKTE